VQVHSTQDECCTHMALVPEQHDNKTQARIKHNFTAHHPCIIAHKLIPCDVVKL
jgi:hypothetical protein